MSADSHITRKGAWLFCDFVECGRKTRRGSSRPPDSEMVGPCISMELLNPAHMPKKFLDFT